jgi:Tfp pilus assembly protein PilF
MGYGLSTGPAWRRRILGIGATLVLLAAAAGAIAKEYRYEDDPVRLGRKAFEENRLQDARRHFQEAIDNDHQVFKARSGLAQILAREGALEEAEKTYRQALAEMEQAMKSKVFSERFPELHAGLGLVLLRLGKLDEARQYLDEALRQQSGMWPAQYGLARLAIMKKDFEEASRLIDRGKDKKGLAEGEDLYLHGMALVQQAQGKLDEAEKNALRAMLLDPAQAEYHTLVAQLYEQKGSPALAIDAFEKALGTPGMIPTAGVYHRLGALYQKEKRYTDALDRYKQSVTVDSTFAPAWKDLATLFALAKRHQEAASAWLRYTQLSPDDLEGQLGLAQACLETKRLQTALQAAERAWGMDSTRVDVRLAMARAAALNKNEARAEWLYYSVGDTTLFEPADLIRLGQMKLKAKQFEESERLLRRALARDTSLADGYFSMGLLKLNVRAPDSAEVYLRKAVALVPNSSGARLNLGIAMMQQKNSAGAIPELRQATKMAPDYAQGHLYLAHALVAVDSLPAAEAEYRRVLELSPNDAAAMRGVGFILLGRGETAEAVSVLRRATQADPTQIDGWVLLGQSLLTDGEFVEAETCFRRALEIRPGHAAAQEGLDAARQGYKKGTVAAGPNGRGG